MTGRVCGVSAAPSSVLLLVPSLAAGGVQFLTLASQLWFGLKCQFVVVGDWKPFKPSPNMANPVM